MYYLEEKNNGQYVVKYYLLTFNQYGSYETVEYPFCSTNRKLLRKFVAYANQYIDKNSRRKGTLENIIMECIAYRIEDKIPTLIALNKLEEE